jgi:thermitase
MTKVLPKNGFASLQLILLFLVIIFLAYIFNTTVFAGRDTLAPTVSILAPTNQATVSGIVPFEITASDKNGIGKVEVTGDFFPIITLNQPPYKGEWDTRNNPDGLHFIHAHGYDPAGNQGVAHARVTVANNPNSPAVTIISPSECIPISGITTVEIAATAKVGEIANVQILNGGPPNFGTTNFTSPPYKTSWDTTGTNYSMGPLTVQATDTLGNKSINTIFTIVDNSMTGRGWKKSGGVTDTCPPY